MDITDRNFKSNLDEISEVLKSCAFVSIDAEFSALLSDDRFKNRLFDTNQERYDRIKNGIGNMVITQLGLTFFTYDHETSDFKAKTFTFHLRPQRFVNIDQSFVLQASTLDFLCRYNFDFNKVLYNGISHLNQEEEAYVNDILLKEEGIVENLDLEEKAELQECCSIVSKWLTKETEETLYIGTDSELLKYIIHKEIRKRFPNVLTTNSLGESNRILIYRDSNVKGSNEISEKELRQNLINHLLGFSHVFKLLIKAKKPVVFHNGCYDLLLMYQQFIGQLPRRYSDFKKKYNEIFPHIYDTKYISAMMAKKLTLDEVWKSNALQQLYCFFKEEQCKKLRANVNNIVCLSEFNEVNTYHEAGWDSYCTGYCFFRLGHWSASLNMGTSKKIGPLQLFTALEAYDNKVNVMRGSMPYINMSGTDPPVHRPSLMLVKSLRGAQIDIVQVANVLSTFGSVDVKPFGKNSALVAANTQSTLNRIMKGLPSDAYQVMSYSPLKHSPSARIAMWSGALISSGIFIWLLKNKLKNVALTNN